MDPIFEERLVLQSGCVSDEGTVLVIALEESKASARFPHAHILMSTTTGWVRVVTVEYDCVRIAWQSRPGPHWVVLGDTGSALKIDRTGAVTEERIFPIAKPGQRGLMRSIKICGDSIFAVGMNREIFENKNGAWSDEAGVPKSWSAPGPITGFESAGGASSDEIYAVGWEGEIALRKRGVWRRVVSPTNLILTGVTVSPDGEAYACGQRGTLIWGREDMWTLRQPDRKEDFWDTLWYRDQLYVSSLRSVFVLENDVLQRVDMGDATTTTCYHLSGAGPFLCSVGSRAVGLFDGNEWQRLPMP